MSPRRNFLISVCIGVVATALLRVDLRAQAGPAADLLSTVGAYVQRYYASAQRVVARERVTLQELGQGLTPAGFPRRLEYELRVEWTPAEDGQAGEAQVHRTLLSVNGRPPKATDEPGCSDPRSLSPEPLAMLLPSRQDEFTFQAPKRGRAAGRPVLMVDYQAAVRGVPSVTWDEDCVSIDLPGRSVGRVWADPVTGEVLRLDEHLVGMFDVRVPEAQQRKGASPVMTLERVDTSIRYKPVRFQDPEETVLMPSDVDTLMVVRGGGTPRLRIHQEFRNYRRFLVQGRILLSQ